VVHPNLLFNLRENRKVEQKILMPDAVNASRMAGQSRSRKFYCAGSMHQLRIEVKEKTHPIPEKEKEWFEMPRHIIYTKHTVKIENGGFKQ